MRIIIFVLAFVMFEKAFSTVNVSQINCLVSLYNKRKSLPIKPIQSKELAKKSVGSSKLKFRDKQKYDIPEEVVLANARLGREERFDKAMNFLNKEVVNTDHQKTLKESLEKAHQLAPTRHVYGYSWPQLRAKYKVLREGGFSRQEADNLIRFGYAGKPPLRELIKPGKTLFHDYAKDILDKDYLADRKKLKKILSQKKRKDDFENLEAMYFVDYSSSIKEVMSVINGKTLKSTRLKKKYTQKAFNNFRATREWLLKSEPPLNKETLLSIHKRMLKGGVGDFGKSSDLGQLRKIDIFAGIDEVEGLEPWIVKNIKNNPYLKWTKNFETASGNLVGDIAYPSAEAANSFVMNILKKKKPKLAQEINDFQNLPKQIEKKKDRLIRHMSPDSKTAKKLQQEIKQLKQKHTMLQKEAFRLNQELVDALLDDVMDWYVKQRTKIGDVKTPDKLDRFVDLLADFQRRLISIHPLTDGNGRSTREFVSYALMKEGFPPPRIIDPNADLELPLEDWQLMVKHGILSTSYVVDDLLERLDLGLPIENSLDLTTPYSRPPVQVRSKGKRGSRYMKGVEYIDPKAYRKIFQDLLKKKRTIASDLEIDPLHTWDEIHDEVKNIFDRNNIYYHHKKNGLERVELGYVDNDFVFLFGNASYKNPKIFDYKMKNWYTDQMIWRGLASDTQGVTEREIIDMFKKLSPHMASNEVLNKIGESSSHKKILKAALEDFKTYNSDVLDDRIVEMARDHSTVGPLYDSSYGFSTSKSRKVGKAFAMGAMAFAEYGEQADLAVQALLKSRVLVGARKSVKDVDLTRLKQIRKNFSYQYGRQQEVMGIGASDPDSIVTVQLINEYGGVDKTYLRNKYSPNEIFVIEGEFSPEKIPRKNQVMKIIKLK